MSTCVRACVRALRGRQAMWGRSHPCPRRAPRSIARAPFDPGPHPAQAACVWCGCMGVGGEARMNNEGGGGGVGGTQARAARARPPPTLCAPPPLHTHATTHTQNATQCTEGRAGLALAASAAVRGTTATARSSPTPRLSVPSVPNPGASTALHVGGGGVEGLRVRQADGWVVKASMERARWPPARTPAPTWASHPRVRAHPHACAHPPVHLGAEGLCEVRGEGQLGGWVGGGASSKPGERRWQLLPAGLLGGRGRTGGGCTRVVRVGGVPWERGVRQQQGRAATRGVLAGGAPAAAASGPRQRWRPWGQPAGTLREGCGCA